MDVDVTQRRKLISQAGIERGLLCPACRIEVVQDFQSYAIVVKSGANTSDTFVIGSDCGWYCPGCPNVILDSDEIEAALQQAVPYRGFSYAEMGIVTSVPMKATDHIVQLKPDDSAIHVVTFIRDPVQLSLADESAIEAARARRERRRQKLLHRSSKNSSP